MKKFSPFSLTAIKKLLGKGGSEFHSHIPKEKQDAMIIEKLPGYFLLFALILVFYYMYQVLLPFLAVLLLSAVIAIAFYPVYKKFLHWVGNRPRIASALSCLFVFLVIIVPIVFFVLMLSDEAVSTYQLVRTKIESGVFDKYIQWYQSGTYYYKLKELLDPYVDINTLDLKQNLINLAQGVSSFIFDQTANIFKGLSGLILNFVIMMFAMYYFFKDGADLVKKLGFMSPLPSVYETELFGKMDSMVKAIVYGVFFTAILQGLVGGVGFYIAGISNPIFWGICIAATSFLPMIGTTLIWVPAVVVLLIMGAYWQAIFLAIWGVFAIGTSDNVARTYLIGRKANTYPMITFFVILGGVWTMGLKGIIIGPLILMALLSLLHIYEAEYKKVLKK